MTYVFVIGSDTTLDTYDLESRIDSSVNIFEYSTEEFPHCFKMMYNQLNLILANKIKVNNDFSVTISRDAVELYMLAIKNALYHMSSPEVSVSDFVKDFFTFKDMLGNMFTTIWVYNDAMMNISELIITIYKKMITNHMDSVTLKMVQVFSVHNEN